MQGFSREDAERLERATLMKELPLASLCARQELLDCVVRTARLVLSEQPGEQDEKAAKSSVASFSRRFCFWLKASADELFALLLKTGAVSKRGTLYSFCSLPGPAIFSSDSLSDFLKERALERERVRQQKVALLQQRNESVNRAPRMPADAEMDRRMMRLALDEAAKAAQQGEVPVGAVLTVGGQVLCSAGNRVIADHDPTAHAEMLVIRQACAELANERLEQAVLYVTLEPCGMCAAAVAAARVRRVVWAAGDPQRGAFGGKADLSEVLGLNHRAEGSGGVCEAEAKALLEAFFQARRRAVATKESEQ